MDAKDIAEYQMIYGSDPPFQKLAKAHLDLLEQNRWIPVSERLPEEDTWCLVACENDVGFYSYAQARLFNGWWLAGPNGYEEGMCVHYWKLIDPPQPKALEEE